MNLYKLLPLVTIFIFLGCSTKPLESIKFEENKKQISYENQVKPVLDSRCVVCHSCYNSPCQLKLSSYEGVDRGATKAEVYANRLAPANMTRLFFDANSTSMWRDKGFYSVISKDKNLNNSTMMYFLNQKRVFPDNIGEYKPESDELSCARDKKELEDYFDDNPHKGMPYGFPALNNTEYNILANWLNQGAKNDTKNTLSKSSYIKKFEEFLNKQDTKHKVTARYIYEHLYLAHIKFPDDDSFYELVRSYTKTPNDIKVVATRFPYDGVKKEFFYRFRKINSTIVHKTHMVYKLDNSKLNRYKELFIKTPWIIKPELVSYEKKIASNPLLAYEQIPALSRYKFLLDDIHFFIMTFIRGPVCKGQIALNVINDHFWVAFKEPKEDILLFDRFFLHDNLNNLRIPNEYGANVSLLKTIDILKYNNETIDYYRNKNSLYKKMYKNGLDISTIWKGNKVNKRDNDAILTIYRHFDSASVHKGALGDIPKTLWVIDYPLIERLYYSLVAGFDVYGNISHQLLVRKYMDRLRIEGESNFLEYLPKESRHEIFESWYLGWLAKQLTTYTPSKNKTAINFKSTDYKEEFVEKLLDYTNIKRDKINYIQKGYKETPIKKVYNSKEEIEETLKSLTLPKNLNFFRHFNSFNSNLSYIRIEMKNQKDLVYSLVINRWHDSVALLFNEKNRLDAKKDKINFIEGFIGSYPNIFAHVKQEDLANFFKLIKNYKGTREEDLKISKYFIGRANKNFWKEYDWFQKRFKEDEPITNGVFDLNRYLPDSFE